MKLIKSLVLLLLLTSYQTFAQQQDPKVKKYIETYKHIAMVEMARTGVPACITLAQGILESAAGESALATRSNNHFGIKCKTEWTGAKTYHDDDAKDECFRVYNNVEESFIDHSDFLKNRPFYKDLFTLQLNDYKGWAYGLKKAGYATNKNYPALLINLIERYALYDYSSEVIANYDMYRTLALNRSMKANDYHALAKNAVKSDKKEFVEKVTVVAAPAVTEKKTESRYPEGFFTINGCKVFYAPEGLSLYAFATNRKMSYARLLALNNLTNEDVLTKGMLVYLDKRKRKGDKQVHVTRQGETLRDIALQEGVRLESLVKYNKINADSRIAAGQQVYLQKRASSKINVLN